MESAPKTCGGLRVAAGLMKPKPPPQSVQPLSLILRVQKAARCEGRHVERVRARCAV